MAELGSGSGTSYPTALDTDATIEDTSMYARANVPNDLAAAVVAIETELGTDPAGTLTDVKTFLQTEHNTNGSHNLNFVCGVINWLSTSTRLTGGTDYTVDGVWTDLDLTAYTSANAKFIIMSIILRPTSTVGDLFCVRKNGETPTYVPTIQYISAQAQYLFLIFPMGSGQVIEYYTDDASDTWIDIFGYIE